MSNRPRRVKRKMAAAPPVGWGSFAGMGGRVSSDSRGKEDSSFCEQKEAKKLLSFAGLAMPGGRAGVTVRKRANE